MKRKIISELLLISVFCGSITGCGILNNSNESESTTTSEEEEDDRDRREPRHDFSTVQERATFEDFYVDPVDTPWAEEHELTFVRGNVETYFAEYFMNYSGREADGEALNNVATIYRPSVTCYPAERDNYVIYEVSYTEIFPIRARLSSTNVSTGWSYHNVQFMDYYTGMEYPTINMSTDVDSFGVTGNVIYNGQTFYVEYYEFREDFTDENSYDTDANGNTIWTLTDRIEHTAYFVVPAEYDGLVMFVYVADDSDAPFSEYEENDVAEYSPPVQFGAPGSDEYLEDYRFYAIREIR